MPALRPDEARPPWLDRALGPVDGGGVRVAVIDSGIDPEWEDGGFAAGVGLVGDCGGKGPVPSLDRRDRLGHGTACAGILQGMAPGAEIHPVKVFLDRLQTSVSTLVAALDWCVAEAMDVVNLSLGTRRGEALEPLYAACERARRGGLVVVAAVAADGGGSFPAIFENALGVGAGRFASIYDLEYRPGAAVECVAQGFRRVRVLGGRSLEATATSYAAPHVSAWVALLRQRHPGAGLDEIRSLLPRYALTGAGRATPAPPILTGGSP